MEEDSRHNASRYTTLVPLTALPLELMENRRAGGHAERRYSLDIVRGLTEEEF